MDFNEHKPIYLQISDNICEKILTEEWPADERIPSVRELGSNLGVNPNTIMRTYEHLENLNIISNKRGVGFFVENDAKSKIVKIQRDQFLKEELPLIIKKMSLLGIQPSDVFNC
ncbi:MAG: GntR family transcriptional regulator [Bacteroidetes bacterium HGW-Bacteroidetes-7]|jgi:DNA-binding transcriptional regulator YhcF (GntR family)|nr:MAG: GntR family transcriptional regulator [Bacteroidetes bacterium HGW-Bacteroidetes-7]